MAELNNMSSMASEVIEAICEHFKDDEEIQVDCLRYLGAIGNARLSFCCDQAIEEMNRCSFCGEKYKYMNYRGYHPETTPPSWEDMVEQYCPNCDISRGGGNQ